MWTMTHRKYDRFYFIVDHLLKKSVETPAVHILPIYLSLSFIVYRKQKVSHRLSSLDAINSCSP
jgi:hypothetical protein